jgi:hypothetical protein
MKIVLNIPDVVISKLKYVLLGFFIIISIGYVYFFE